MMPGAVSVRSPGGTRTAAMRVHGREAAAQLSAPIARLRPPAVLMAIPGNGAIPANVGPAAVVLARIASAAIDRARTVIGRPATGPRGAVRAAWIAETTSVRP